MHFAQPLISVGGGPSVEVLENTLKVASSIWNAVVICDSAPDSRGEVFLKFTRHALESVDKAGTFIRLFDELVERKRGLFPDMQVLIHGYEVRQNENGDIAIEVESKPSPKPK